MTGPQRKSKVTPLEEAAALVKDGDTLGIGGQHSHNVPMALVREIAKRRVRDLTLVPSASMGIAVDLLIAAGCVRKLHVSYIGLEFVGFAPNFRRACERGEIEVIEADEPWIVFGLKAAGAGLPFIPVSLLYESTDLPKVNPLLKKTIDPYTGREVTTIPPLRPDVGIIHAQKCDPWGNARVLGSVRFEHLMAKASKKVIVSADEVASPMDPPEDPLKVTVLGPLVTAVVETPYGAHPTASPALYNYDDDHLREYARMGREGKMREYLETFVYGPRDHEAYLEKIGVRRLLGLKLK